MNERVKQLTCWETRDRCLHRNREAAERHATRLEDYAAANEMLKAGASVASAARRAGLHVKGGSILERMTAETPLIISHYQCRRSPEYRVSRFDEVRGVLVQGRADRRTGAYSTYENLSDVIRYAEETARRQPSLFTER